MALLTSVPVLEPHVELPTDEGLPGLSSLLDERWVWETFCANVDQPQEVPHRIRPRQIRYTPGKRAMVSYVAEWTRDEWIEEDQFAAECDADGSTRFFHYPNDPALPGLRSAASAIEAQDLINKYVPVTPAVVRVEAVRYRPMTRAVLRHRARWRRSGGGRISLFVRVMPPERLPRLLTAWDLAEQSRFVLPELMGVWTEGGVVWMNKIRGQTVRKRILAGKAPEPGLLFDALAGIWSTPMKEGQGQAMNVKQGYKSTHRLISHIMKGDDDALSVLESLAEVLKPFSAAWKPTALAHNDFYDDQIILTKQRELALVDFEEIGPGDPMMDIGNLLAHQGWMSRFGTAREACGDFRRRVRAEALTRFGWKEEDLNLREAYSLFRLSTNPFRRLSPKWKDQTVRGLRLAKEALAASG